MRSPFTNVPCLLPRSTRKKSCSSCMICAWSRETRGSAITRSLSTFRPTVNGVRFRMMSFCSLPCTNLRTGKIPEPELIGLVAVKVMDGHLARSSPSPVATASARVAISLAATDYSAAALSGNATQFRAGATTVVWGDSRYSGGQRVRLEQLPDDLLAQAGTLGLAGAVYRSEYVAVGDAGGGRPRISRHLDPSRHRHRPDAAVLSN